MHPSELNDACLGKEKCFRSIVDGLTGNVKQTEVSRKLKPGDTQEMQFKQAIPDQQPYPDDGPPFDNPRAPVFDHVHTTKPTRTKKGRAKKSQPAPTPVEVVNMVEGYAGKPKGAKQILWERGLYKEGTV